MDAYDFAIIGAGCSGLSLATHLLRAGVEREKILILDADSPLKIERRWCLFDTQPHPFEHCVSHRWNSIQVGINGDLLSVPLRECSYTHIPSGAFFASTLQALSEAGNVDVKLDAPVTSISPDGAIRAGDGRRWQAGHVFDSRPTMPKAKPCDVTLWQQFVGWRIETDFDAFDPESALMMDFRTDTPHIEFTYVLPFSRRHALVEATAFADRFLSWYGLTRSVEQWLRQRKIASFQIKATERGRIAMTTADVESRVSKRVSRIGLAGGMAKPSTGYAFGDIQRSCARIAEKVATGSWSAVDDDAQRRQEQWRNGRTRFLDRVFLSYLHRHPERAPELFMRMFRRCDADAMARFLSDGESLWDDLRVIRSMPKLPFMWEAMRSYPLWLTRPQPKDSLKGNVYRAGVAVN